MKENHTQLKTQIYQGVELKGNLPFNVYVEVLMATWFLVVWLQIAEIVHTATQKN